MVSQDEWLVTDLCFANANDGGNHSLVLVSESTLPVLNEMIPKIVARLLPVIINHVAPKIVTLIVLRYQRHIHVPQPHHLMHLHCLDVVRHSLTHRYQDRLIPALNARNFELVPKALVPSPVIGNYE